MRSRDPRRRLTADERRRIYELTGGLCQRCGDPLGVDYHNAHLAAWSNGGSTDVDNMRPWCPPCNLKLGANDVVPLGPIKLREWQAQALPVILHRIWQTGVATINAAPGAGKTIFAGLVFKHLLEANLVERLVVVCPNTVLVDQWKRVMGKMRVQLDIKPRDGHLQHPDTCGMVVTYQGLPGTADAHRVHFDDESTLVVFDEVHHVALPENAAWGDAVRRMVGDLHDGSVHPAGVLNMTGTLFRSGRDKRISTVRYNRVLNEAGEEKLEAAADWSIKTADLIGVELRPPDLYVYGTQAQLIDTHNETVVTGDLGDLDKQQRQTVLRGLDKSSTWLHGFIAEAVRLLDNQLRATGNAEPLKLLYCATEIPDAKLAADIINQVTRSNFARLIHSKDPGARTKLEAAARESKPCAIVQVNMASEGFDCPQVSTIAYASNVIAPLRIAQVMARAMRITPSERSTSRMLPAQILIPDNCDLRKVFGEALTDLPRLIDDGDGNVVCFRCSMPKAECICVGDGPRTQRGGRYELINLSGPEFQQADVLGQPDGEVVAAELSSAEADLRGLGIPDVYHPRAIVFGRRYRPMTPIYTATAPMMEPEAEPQPPSVTVEEVNPRDLNQLYRRRLALAAGWMAKHVDHDDRYRSAEHFQFLANKAVGIEKGERDMADTRSLKRCGSWMCRQIRLHCKTHGEAVPSWANPTDA